MNHLLCARCDAVVEHLSVASGGMQRFAGPHGDVWLLWGYTGISSFVQRGADTDAEPAAVKRHEWQGWRVMRVSGRYGASRPFRSHRCRQCQLPWTAKVHRRLR